VFQGISSVSLTQSLTYDLSAGTPKSSGRSGLLKVYFPVPTGLDFLSHYTNPKELHLRITTIAALQFVFSDDQVREQFQAPQLIAKSVCFESPQRYPAFFQMKSVSDAPLPD